MNLNDALSSSQPGARRAFYAPLASVPPVSGNQTMDWTTTRLLPASAFEGFLDSTNDPSAPPINASQAIASISFDTFISSSVSPASENGLPSPAIRLHAIDGGRLYFRAKTNAPNSLDQLELRLGAFEQSIATAPWFQRWVEADCIPQSLWYENVDRATLQALLNNIPVLTGNAAQDHYFGVSFPSGVTQATKQTYLDQFLQGTQPLLVRPGAYLGAAAFSSNPQSPQRFQLRLKAFYAAHTQARPRPINPRELFHLLFSDDSAEAQTHPLLRAIEAFGVGQTTGDPESRRMRLRPPLRTWQRVCWEAELERSLHDTQWAKDSLLGARRFYNTTHALFNPGAYGGAYKCNLFVSDICLRSGFRIATHLVTNNRWHYLNASTFANSAHIVNERDKQSDRVAIVSSRDNPTRLWGWGMENWLRSTIHQTVDEQSDLQTSLNNAMEREGRCFILACARPTGRSGHIVIIKRVTGQPALTNTSENDPNDVGHKKQGLARMPIDTYEAAKSGAQSIDKPFALAGTAGQADARVGFTRIHLIELHPGQDPDTLQGLLDLNTRHRHIDPLGAHGPAQTLTRVAKRTTRSATAKHATKSQAKNPTRRAQRRSLQVTA